MVTSINNPQTLSPTFYLAVEEVEVDEKIILYIHVPESSQVHRCKGKIFDRNEDGDFDVTNNTNLVSGLYIRKQSTHTENRIFPYAEMGRLESELFTKVRKLAENRKDNHPWIFMKDIEILKSAGLYLSDPNRTQGDGSFVLYPTKIGQIGVAFNWFHTTLTNAS